MPSSEVARFGSFLALERTRSLLMGLRYRLLVGVIGLSYVLGTMLFSGMLFIPSHPLNVPVFFFIEPAGYGASWTYPAILAGNAYFQVDLPMLSSILMTLSAAGIGLGMALAVRLVARLVRNRVKNPLRPTALGSVAGLTPAMIAFLTLGACCSTTAAATAGISLGAHSGGIGVAGVLANTWYLGVIQVAIVYAALLAQEQLLRVYELFQDTSRSESSGTDRSPAPGFRSAESHDVSR
jgi:hypothetical protein